MLRKIINSLCRTSLHCLEPVEIMEQIWLNLVHVIKFLSRN
jgi:hypothetical protein